MEQFIYSGTGTIRTEMGEKTLTVEPGGIFDADAANPYIAGLIEHNLIAPYRENAPLRESSSDEED